MAIIPKERKSLLSSQARVMAPWIKVVIGKYTFGVYDKRTRFEKKDDNDFYTVCDVQYPNYIQSLSIVKINGQVNQYTLTIDYPIRQDDDPNFFEKVFSSVSNSRKIVFSYGDASMPSYIYKDEEAIITKIGQTFDLANCKITYTVSAVSSASLSKIGNHTFKARQAKPSDVIKDLFNNPTYKLNSIFSGMNKENLNDLIASDDKKVKILAKTNISVLDYISYLVSCMMPAGSTQSDISKNIYVMTIHDDTVYDSLYSDSKSLGGPYFKVESTSYSSEQSDAYEVDIGINTSTIVTGFSINQNENYSIFYDYASEVYPENYTRRLNSKGQWEDVFAPTFTSGNDNFMTRAEDVSWYTKITKYPISATLKLQGLLRPATLMQYLRLNVIFPGGHKHISSGLYIVTKQVDEINGNGYQTTLSLTKIGGDGTLKN